MSGFFETSDGWVNVDHVMRVWHGVTREAAPGDESIIELSDGRKVRVQVLGFTVTPPVPAPPAAETDVGFAPTLEAFAPGETAPPPATPTP